MKQIRKNDCFDRSMDKLLTDNYNKIFLDD